MLILRGSLLNIKDMDKLIPAGQLQDMTVNMEPIGKYHLADIDWRVEYFASLGSSIIKKTEATKVDENTYIVTVDTGATGTGELRGILYPLVPAERGYKELLLPFSTGEEVVSKYDERLYGVRDN